MSNKMILKKALKEYLVKNDNFSERQKKRFFFFFNRLNHDFRNQYGQRTGLCPGFFLMWFLLDLRDFTISN